MATDLDKAAYYENKIDYYFNTAIPRDTLAFASKGLVYEPGGVVIHEDGIVTLVGVVIRWSVLQRLKLRIK